MSDAGGGGRSLYRSAYGVPSSAADTIPEAVRIIQDAAAPLIRDAKLGGRLEFELAGAEWQDRGPWTALEIWVRSSKLGHSVFETITEMPTAASANKMLRRLARQMAAYQREQAQRAAAWRGMDR